MGQMVGKKKKKRRLFLLLFWQFPVNVFYLLILLVCLPNQIALWAHICLWSSNSSFFKFVFLLLSHHEGGWLRHCFLQLVLPLDCSNFSTPCRTMGLATHFPKLSEELTSVRLILLYSLSLENHTSIMDSLSTLISSSPLAVSFWRLSREDSCESWQRWTLREKVVFRKVMVT